MEELNQETQGYIEFIHPNFLCALISIDRYDVFCEKHASEQQYYMKLMVLHTCCEVTNQKYMTTGLIYDKNRIAIVINCELSDPALIRSDLQGSFKTLQNEVAKVLSNTITIGIGSCYESLENICLSFNEAQEAMKRRIVEGVGSIIFYTARDEETKYFYPYNIEKRILNFLQLGSREDVILALEDLKGEIRGNKEISPENVEQIYIQLVGNTVKLLVESNINISNIFGSSYNVFQKLFSKEDLDGINTWLTGFYSGIMQYISESSDKRAPKADMVMDYIHIHFRSDIDTTSISDNTGVCYSSVGRIVRSKTGKNVLEYINRLRIEEAKRLLRQTDMNMKEIAVNIGYNNEQSFFRYFRKLEGLTPGEFRSLR
jgi:YesN/AraC family two-component response regulator